jgi:predicted GNAT family acetyltransferase
VLADTPEAVYLEGVYVRAEERGQGYGTRCLSQLGRWLLRRAGAVCLAVNERQRGARAFYARAGFALRGGYDTIYLRRDGD